MENWSSFWMDRWTDEELNVCSKTIESQLVNSLAILAEMVIRMQK